MADLNADPAPMILAGLPILPTGSGVADVEIAYERMRLAEEADDGGVPATAGVESDAAARAPSFSPTEDGADAAESAAHPS